MRQVYLQHPFALMIGNMKYIYTLILCVTVSTFAEDRPNILWLSAEDISPHLGCYGDLQAITPNLDQLAKRGTVFSNAYCNVPICVPSRASFATGQYAHTSGHWDNATPYTGTPESGWLHVSYNKDGNRKQRLRAFRNDSGKTQYEEI